jgi:hypothetical protein
MCCGLLRHDASPIGAADDRRFAGSPPMIHPRFTPPADVSLMQSILDMLRVAIGHHQASRHAEAEALYRSVLGVAPSHPQALYLLGWISGGPTKQL